MAKHYHTCGASIWTHSRWNGLEHIPVFSNVDCNEVSHCPGCGEYLVRGELLKHPPERDDDLVPRLLEALEPFAEKCPDDGDEDHPVTITVRLKYLQQARAAIEAAREG